MASAANNPSWRALRSIRRPARSVSLTATVVSGRQLDLSKLSTGELQLYSMALLESLRVTGGRDYPLLVDTPLAYLDEQHREALLSDLLFASRGQVVLFATDQEIDSNALERWAPDVDRVYRLRFNTDAQSSVAATEVSGSTSAELSGQVA